MNQMTDYEYEAMQKKEAEQVAIKAEQKRDFKGWLIGIVLWLAATVLLMCADHWYYRWLTRDFTPPPELLTEAEFRELVDGYPLLAEALHGTYSDDAECIVRGCIRYEKSVDDERKITVHFDLNGRYGGMHIHYDVQEGQSTEANRTYELREAEAFKLHGDAERYSFLDLGKGKPHTAWREDISAGDHTANLFVSVMHPSSDHSEFRKVVEEMLRIVRGE